MGYVERARASGRRRVRHFGGGFRPGGLLVTVERIRTVHDRPAGTSGVEVVPPAYSDVPAVEVTRRSNDAAGVSRVERSIKIAGADLPGVDFTKGDWRLAMPGGDYLMVPRLVSAGDPSAQAPILWVIPRTEGAPA